MKPRLSRACLGSHPRSAPHKHVPSGSGLNKLLRTEARQSFHVCGLVWLQVFRSVLRLPVLLAVPSRLRPSCGQPGPIQTGLPAHVSSGGHSHLGMDVPCQIPRGTVAVLSTRSPWSPAWESAALCPREFPGSHLPDREGDDSWRATVGLGARPSDVPTSGTGAQATALNWLQ